MAMEQALSSSSNSKRFSFSRFCSKLSLKRANNNTKNEEEATTTNLSDKQYPIQQTGSSTGGGSGRSSKDSCLERVFTYFDEDGDGRVSPAELRRGVKAVGGELTAEEAEEAVRLSDSDGDGLLCIEDFTKLMVGEENRREDELFEAFKMYADVEGTSTSAAMSAGHVITPRSLKRMLSKLGESTSTDRCKDMILRFDINGDGVLNFEEFKIMMMMPQA